MRILNVSLLAVAIPFFMACGDSGPSDGDRVSDLSVSEYEDLCFDTVDDFPERTVTCNGQSFTVGLSSADCEGQTVDDLPPEGCPLTVGQLKACINAQAAMTDAELCEGTIPTECTPLQNEACSTPDA